MTTRGRLRIYLGAAPGVGKTYAMLSEAQRRLGRGTDVVVGYIETHGRQVTERLLDGLEVVSRRTTVHRGATLTELDTDAVIARAPAVALIDEYAHTNIPGSRNAKRWQDVEEILAAGIDVITTLNIQHLESMREVVEQITRTAQHETVPDAMVRRAAQIELIDMAPEALRRRVEHGNVLPPDQTATALNGFFRLGNLTTLRELTLLWVADTVADELDRYRTEHDRPEDLPERVVVALSGGTEGETLIRRAARIVARSGADSELMAVYVTPGDGLAAADPAVLERQRGLVESLGGTFHEVNGTDIPHALLDFTRAVAATQLVLGASRRGRFAQILTRGVAATTTALSGTIDVHVVTHEQAAVGTRGLRFRRRLGRRDSTMPVEVAGRELRTPLAAAKAAIESLLSQDVAWSPLEREELLGAARDSLERLDHAVTNLLDTVGP